MVETPFAASALAAFLSETLFTMACTIDALNAGRGS